MRMGRFQNRQYFLGIKKSFNFDIGDFGFKGKGVNYCIKKLHEVYIHGRITIGLCIGCKQNDMSAIYSS